MDIIEILKDDYQRFPVNQTYEIYAPNVYFKDPVNEFRGIKRYQEMITFMGTWFKEIKMDLHDIHQKENIIYTQWTLHWTTPVPWQPRISIPGRSELTLDDNHLIVSHVDYWNCSRWDVVKQHLSS
ncbi:conserved hypothetical protein [Gloeothece citriformis PCC 7424]|uniref:SnoaL-like domain-containing protein n=1 Tax=Gloeothece citriformis (strain PCC 7424) TaxID=65393 RepID=B7KHL8_GLOC7|nr:DUF2358 domain-containing protein [Gloeothece citriformis]ACK70713.1 conserved hypothetical protein [Gloeothece citriformis PCC 7424]